jgi:hypothetical protein
MVKPDDQTSQIDSIVEKQVEAWLSELKGINGGLKSIFWRIRSWLV